MFKKSRQKIVAVIMVILIVLFAGTLGIIYASSYSEVYLRNQEMLEHHIALMMTDRLPEIPGLPGKQPDLPLHDPDEPDFDDDTAYQLSTFYTVAADADGNILFTDNTGSAYTDEELLQTAEKVLKSGKNAGTGGSLVYRVKTIGEHTVIAFMDNTLMQESITTLFRYTLIFGGLAIVIIFFLSCYAAKRIVQPLEESYQKQKQFISDAGHELKTPVSVVSANVELLTRELGESPWLANIRHENIRMGELVTQLLELARTENVTPQMERTDYSRIATGEALAFESVAFEKGFSLDVQIEDNIFVMGNGTQLAQLTSILLDNAMRHSIPAGTIRVILKKERGSAVLQVINAGEAIPDEQKKHLFERFYRADEARTGGEGHYGLGLAIAKAIVTAHKGRIDISCYDGLVEFRVGIAAL